MYVQIQAGYITDIWLAGLVWRIYALDPAMLEQLIQSYYSVEML